MTPPENFVPLTAAPAPAAQREFRVAILNSHDHGGSSPAKSAGFQTLEAQRITAVNGGPGGEKKIGEPRITLQRDGDRVTHLRIQCTCGGIMELACVYDAPAPAA